MRASLPPRLRRIFLAACIAGSTVVVAPAADPIPERASGAGDVTANKKASSNKTITVAAGGLPVILTAPHGGSAAIPGVPERKGDGATRFNPRADTNTDILTEKLADALEQKLGKRPYVVIARFHRKYIDANRRPQDAFEAAEAKPTYDAYHAAIASACREVTARWGRGIVLDIHGQAAQPGVVLRGTQNGRTVAHLIRQSGREAVYGETSLFGQLAKQGFAVFPAVGLSDPEEPNYSGGHTVGIHGSSAGGTIDAIQLELGTKYRDSQAIGDGAEKLANAITAFAKTYLPAEEKKSQASNAAQRSGNIAVGVYVDTGAGPSVNDLLRVQQKVSCNKRCHVSIFNKWFDVWRPGGEHRRPWHGRFALRSRTDGTTSRRAATSAGPSSATTRTGNASWTCSGLRPPVSAWCWAPMC